MNEAEFRAELQRRGYGEPEVAERPANLVNEPHVHEFSASALILEGEVTLTTADGAKTCRAGDHFELTGGIEHTERYGPEGARFLIAKRTP